MRRYWMFSDFYYDKIAHLIGGIALGLAVFVSILTAIHFNTWKFEQKSVLMLTALLTFLFGIIWEVEGIGN